MDNDTLRLCWTIALNVDDLEVQDDSNFFKLGGDSIQALRLAEAVQEHHANLDVEAIFTHPTFQEMLAYFKVGDTITSPVELKAPESLSESVISRCARICNLDPSTVEDVFPVELLQYGRLQKHLKNGTSMVQVVFELQGTQDATWVCVAFEAIHAKNQIFRTRLYVNLQAVIKEPITWLQATNLDRYLASDWQVRFRMKKPLVRYAIIRELGKTYIGWTCQYSAEDAWTRRLLLDDLECCFADPAEFDAKPLRPQFKKFVEHKRSLNKKEADAFWKAYLANFRYSMPLFQRPETCKTFMDSSFSTTLPINRPKHLAITFSNIALTALALAISQVTGAHDVGFICTKGFRTISLPRVDAIMGPLSSSVPTFVQLSPLQRVSEVLHHVQEDSVRMLKYEVSGPNHIWHPRCPTIDDSILFNWLPPGSDYLHRVARFKVNGQEASLHTIQERHGLHSWGAEVSIWDNGDHLRIKTDFDDRVLARELLERVLKLFEEKLKMICEEQDKTVKELTEENLSA